MSSGRMPPGMSSAVAWRVTVWGMGREAPADEPPETGLGEVELAALPKEVEFAALPKEVELAGLLKEVGQRTSRKAAEVSWAFPSES